MKFIEDYDEFINFLFYRLILTDNIIWRCKNTYQKEAEF